MLGHQKSLCFNDKTFEQLGFNIQSGYQFLLSDYVQKSFLEFNFGANLKYCPKIVLGLNFSAKFPFKAELSLCSAGEAPTQVVLPSHSSIHNIEYY